MTTIVRKKNKKGFARAKRVWHISRFRERYELPDDVRYDRGSPLKYTKDFVGSGRDDESCAFWRQLMALRSKKNYDSLRGNFADLKCIAGNQSKEKRGYLLGSNFQPASAKEIGSWLRKNEKQARGIIKDLSEVGLLERVACPVFNGSPEKSGRARKRPGKSGKRRKPLKKKTKAKIRKKVKTNVKTNGEGNTKRAKERQVKEHPTPTTQSLKPQDFAKEGSVIHFPDPPKLKDTQFLGHIARGILHKYNPEAKQFAVEIYQALELPWDLKSEMGKRELGCFASIWQKVISVEGIPSPVINQLRARAISEAQKIAKRKQNKRRGAVWCHVFKNLIAAYSQREKIN